MELITTKGWFLRKVGEVGMTDREKALLWLNSFIKNKEPMTLIPKQLIRLMYDVLKEQEAKQVIRKQCKKEHDDGSVDYFAEWYCPHCNLLILRGFDNPSIKFCYKCGKPILWEGR